MPGNGTFNLTGFFRQMGIKNPQPTMRETVQPVVNVGDFSHLTPQHRPPTAMYGAVIPGFAAELAAVNILSRSPGGTLVPFWLSDRRITCFQVGSPVVLSTPITEEPAGLFSLNPMLSLVQRGTTLSGVRTDFATFVPLENTELPWIWMPRGSSLTFLNTTPGQSISHFTLFLIDLPTPENLEA